MSLSEKLSGFPFILVFVAYFGYTGFQYYNFNYAADGQVEQHRTRLASADADIVSLKKKLEEGKKFLKSLELKKEEIKAQVIKLNAFQGALSETPDVPSLIKLLLTESKKIDLKVDRIEPGKKNQKEYYLEQEFKLDVRGSYQQILMFGFRVSQLQRILRIESYNLKVAPQSMSSRSVTLTAALSVRAYQYTSGKEDQIKADSP